MFNFTTAQRDAIVAARDAGRFADAYDLVVQFGTDASGNPLDGVQKESLIWFEGAADVNRGVGAFSDFIRTYTSEQFQTRFGGSPLSQSQLQGASNAIAQRVLADVLSLNSVPTITSIGLDDASVVAAQFFNGDEAGWSGVPLFVALGVSTPFQQEILEKPGDTYDLVTMTKSFFNAAGSVNFNGQGARLWETATDLVSVGAIGSGFNAAVQASNFVQAAYGGFGALSLLQIGRANVIGQVNAADTLEGLSGREFMHGGGGDDTLKGSGGNDVMDGGDGTDTVDYSDISQKTTFAIKNEGSGTAKFVGSTFGSGTDAFFNVEKIIGTSADDMFQIQQIDPTLESIDGGDNGEEGDLLTGVFIRSGGLKLDTTTDKLTAAGQTIEAKNFERLEGTNAADELIDDGKIKFFNGKGGKDKADYSASSSGLKFHLDGSGPKEEINLKDVEELIATEQADSIFGSDKGDTLEGRGGADRLEGKEGSDTYKAADGDTISDSDGQGSVEFEGIKLTGGKFEPEDPSCEPGNDNEGDGEKEYEGSNGEKYKKEGSGLTVTFNGKTLTIENWSDGDLGITLEDEDPGDGDDCGGPPDDFASPIVLDLDGDGVELVALDDSVAFFDIDRDGQRERTGWIGADDGLLARDHDNSGAIEDANELFGYGETFSGRGGEAEDAGRLFGPSDLDIRFDSGFAQLAAFDFNNDGVIDALDPEFNTFLVWQDANGDGVSEADELISLNDAGIASISLASVVVEETREGHLVTDESTLTTTDGEIREVLDVWFQFNQYDVRFTVPEGLDPALDALPDLRAAGNVKPLRLAMAENPELRALVEELDALTLADLGKLTPLTGQILYAWAGIASADQATGRGTYADQRATAVMEQFADTPFAQWSGANPRPQAGGVLTDQFLALQQFTAGRLAAQTPLGQELFPELTFENNQFLILADGTDSTTVLQRLIDSAPAEVNAALAHFQAGIAILDLVYLSFADVVAAADDGAAYRAAVEASLQTAGINLTYEQILSARIGSDGDDSFLTESFSGFEYGRVIPVVSGGEGDDNIFLGGNEQIVFWGSGQGDDTIRLDPFTSQGWDFTPRVEIRLTGLNQADISFVRVGSSLTTDGAIRIDATGETLTLRNLLQGNADPSGILVFDDGTTISFADFANEIALLAETGTDASELLIQRIGTTLDGGAGDDVLQGADGETNYVFGFGSGNDQIRDSADGTNTVVFGPGVTLADLSFDRPGSFGQDLVITLSSGETLHIRGQYSEITPVVSQFVFETDPPLSAQDILDLFLIDGPGDDVVLGSSDFDFFGGGAGNDTLSGLNGADTYVFSAGDGQDFIDDRGSNPTGADPDGNIFFTEPDRVIVNFNFADMTGIDNGSEIVLIAPTGDQLTIGRGIEEFDFDDVGGLNENDLRVLIELSTLPDAVVGTANDDTLDGTADIDRIAGLSGNDSISGLAGDDTLQGDDGDDSIDGGAGNDVIEGGQGLDIIFGGDGNDSITAGDQSGVSSSLRSANTIDGGAGNDSIEGGFEDDLLLGGDGNDVIEGSFGSDTIEGGLGDDILIDRSDGTTYRYNLGDGNDQIFDDGSRFNTDAIEFGAGIAQGDLTFSFVQVDATPFTDFFGFEQDQWAIRADIAGGGSVTFTGNFFDPVGSIDVLRFDDGSTMTLGQIETILRTPTPEDQLIVGQTRFSDDTLGGGAGNDTLIGNTGDTTFVFGVGDDQDIIIGPDASDFDFTTLRLGPGITPDSITLTRSGEEDKDLTVTLASGDSIIVIDQYLTEQDLFADDGLIQASYIDQITFVDDPSGTIDVDTIRAIPAAGTDGDDVQIGSNINDTFEITAGNDRMIGHRGSDTYTFGIGSSQDVVVETAADLEYAPDSFEFEGGLFDLSLLRDQDTVLFGPGITLADLTLTRTGTELADLRIEVTATGDSLLIENQFFAEGNYGRATREFNQFGGPGDLDFIARFGPGDPDAPELGPNGEVSQEYWNFFAAANFGPEPLFAAGAERFVFDDGTEFTRAEFEALLDVTENDGDNTIRTDDLGGTLDGGGGTDTLLGGTGDDTYLLNIGSFDNFAEDAGGTDTVLFGAGITPELVAFSRFGENGDNLLVEIGGEDRNAVEIIGQFANDGREIEIFRAPDGREFSAQEIRELLLDETSTEAGDSITGFETDDLITGRGGDDVIGARGGTDLVDGGDGRDTAVFRGARADYAVTTEGPWTVVTDLTGRDGETRLINVETLTFLGGDGGVEESEDIVPNTAPITGNVALDGREDTVLIIPAATLLAAASDPDGGSLTVSTVGNALNGTVEIDDAGRIVFTPDADFNGDGSFEFTVADSGGLEATGTATVAIEAVNDAPTAADDVATGTEDTDLVILAADVLANDIDPDGDSLTITSAVSTDGAVASVNGDGNIVLTPDTEFSGEVTVTYAISDGAETDEADIIVTIDPVNDTPIAADDNTAGVEDEALSIFLADLTLNDADADSVSLDVIEVLNAVGGTVEIFEDELAVFTPDADFNGPAQFDYVVSDETGETDTATVFIDIAPVNDAPVANDDAGFGTESGDALTIAAADILANDTDVDGDALVVARIDAVTGGTAEIDVNGDVVFTADAAFTGTATVVYAAADPGGLEDTATISIDVVAGNQAPVLAVPLEDVSSDEDEAVDFAIPAGTFADPDGDTLSLTAALLGGGALPSWLQFDGSAFSGTPPQDFNGTLDIVVTASDGEFTVEDDFTLTINPVNDDPVAVDDSGFSVAAGENVTIQAADLLANDSDVDGDVLTIADVTSGTGGTVVLDANGDAAFAADADFDGTASFTYTVTDGAGGSATATVEVEVDGAVDPYEGFRRGTDGDDFLFGRFFKKNFIFGADGDDFIVGGFRCDHLAGGEGDDLLAGKGGADILEGNEGDDRLFGMFGNDTLAGGTGDDYLRGGIGRDTFVFTEGDGNDRVSDFDAVTYRHWWLWREADVLAFDIDGVDTAAAALGFAEQQGRDVVFDFGDGDSLTLARTRLGQLDEDNILIL